MSGKPITKNTLFYGDNLQILREYIPDESIDLIYLDPPFNSSRTYNVLFKDESGRESDAQITAFEDTWHWNQTAEETFFELVSDGPAHVSKMIRAMREFIGTNQMMAYLVMMAVRLIELHRVLKSTGSIYLHCDPTASHYLKIILDTILGSLSFKNEIIGERSAPKAHAFTRYPSTHDVLLFFSKTADTNWNTQYTGHREEYLESHYANVEVETGRRYTLGACRRNSTDSHSMVICPHYGKDIQIVRQKTNAAAPALTFGLAPRGTSGPLHFGRGRAA